MKRQTSLLIIAILFAALISCSYENTATVTIDTGIRQQAQLSIWDTILAWITFSKPAKADPVPGQLGIESVLVKVSASDMQTIEQDIPLNTGKITLEVPAGSQRTFEVVAKDDDYRRIYGGITTVDLSPGQQVTLNIEMGELISLNSFNPVFENNQITFSLSLTNYNIIAFKLYRLPSDGAGGDIEYLATFTNFSVEGPHQDNNYTFTIPITLEQGTYYISAVNRYGEGDPSTQFTIQ
ncbi:MAG: hypothetical protein WBK20_09220 [Spirochaetota bacterium]